MTSGGNNVKHANDMLTVVKHLILFMHDIRLDVKGRQALAKYIAIAVGAIYYYYRKINFKQKVLLSREVPFFKLLLTILKSGKYKYLALLLAIKALII